jgi:hypothetical protein
MSNIPNKFIAITPNNLSLGVADDRNVVVKLIGMEEEAGLTPGIGVMLVLSPTEARRFAQSLIRVADKAEDGLPRA